ncbi:TPR-like protein, partial [Dioscorea alata]
SADAARRLARALISTAKPARVWSPAHEQTLRVHLLALHCPPLTPCFISAIIDPHLLSHGPVAAGLFHWASLQPGFSHSPLSFHSVIKSLSLSRHSRPLLPLLRLAKSQLVPLLPASYHLAISILLNSNKVIEAFDLIDRVDGVPDELYNSVLSGLAANGSLDLARKSFVKMLERRVRFNDLGFGVFVKRMCIDMGLGGVLGFVDEVTRRDCVINGSVMAALIVDGLCRAERIEEAWRALEQLRAREWKPDFIAYRIVSEAFRLVGRVEEAGRILKQKRKFGVAPRAKDYGDFVLVLISERRIQEAKEMGEAIVTGDFPIDDDVLNALLRSVSVVDPDSAVLFCKYMIEKERFPSTTLLSNLSKNLCKNEKVDEMLGILADLSAKGYFSGVERYNMMLSFLCKVGKVREAYDVLKEMKKKQFSPDVCSYNLLMEACCREDLLRPAKKLWDEMFANGCSPNSQTYSILISKFCEIGNVEEARHLYHHMLAREITLDNTIIGSIIKMLCQEHLFDEAIDIFNKLIEQDISLAGSVLSILVISFCNQGNFDAVLSAMHQLPFVFEDSDSHVILLKNLTDAGKLKMAIEHIQWVRCNSPFKLEKICAELIASLSTSPNPDTVLQLLQEMHVQGLISHGTSLTNLIKGDVLSASSHT